MFAGGMLLCWKLVFGRERWGSKDRGKTASSGFLRNKFKINDRYLKFDRTSKENMHLFNVSKLCLSTELEWKCSTVAAFPSKLSGYWISMWKNIFMCTFCIFHSLKTECKLKEIPQFYGWILDKKTLRNVIPGMCRWIFNTTMLVNREKKFKRSRGNLSSL